MRIRRPPAEWLLDVAFFAGILAYAWAGIDTRLIYHWQGPGFYTTPGFVAEFLKYPGGLAACLSALISQAYSLQIPGALVLAFQLAAVAAVTQVYFTTLAGRSLPLLRFIPAMLLLFSMNLYYDRTPLVPSLLLGLAAAIAFVHLSRRFRNELLLLATYTTLLAVVYYAGGMALVFFAPAAAIVQVASRPRRPVGIAYLVLAAVLPAAIEKFRLVYVPVSARQWFVDTDLRRAGVWWGLYLFYVLATAYVATRPRKSAAPGRWRPAATLAAGFGVMAVLAGVAVAAQRSNARDRRLAALDYYSSQEDWAAVVETSRGLPADDFNSLTRYETNLALHEMNRLGDDMFLFPQKGPILPALRAEAFLPYMIRITDLCLRLGRINEAEHFGNEAIIVSNCDPRVYRLMARLNLVKGQTGAARKFLTVLSHDVGSSGWARRRLFELDQDPQLAADQSVQLLRRRMLRSDDVIPVWQNPDKPDADVERLLLDQLQQDPSNRMAFEFLMGNYLLGRDMPSARGLMPRIKDMTGPAYEGPAGKRRTPRLYQEAMAMYGDSTGTPVEIEGLEIEPETLNRMALFKRIISQSAGRDAAIQALWSRFRDSFFFYFVFGPGDYR